MTEKGGRRPGELSPKRPSITSIWLSWCVEGVAVDVRFPRLETGLSVKAVRRLARSAGSEVDGARAFRLGDAQRFEGERFADASPARRGAHDHVLDPGAHAGGNPE